MLAQRNDDDLAFAAVAPAAGPALLLATIAYIDALQDRLPPVVAALLIARQIDCSAVALAHPLGRLDPAHPETATVVAAIEATMSAIPVRCLTAPTGRVLFYRQDP